MISKIDVAIKRYFTKDINTSTSSKNDDCMSRAVYDLFDWKTVDVLLKNHQTGTIIFEMKSLEFPTYYSQSACDIIASKYFRKKGVPNDRGYEYSMKQLVHRMVLFWTESLFDEKVINQAQKQIVYDELAYMLLSQMFAPNSPQWFNTGLQLAYGITGNSQGHYFYNEITGETVKSKDAYTRTQGSACFIIRTEDSLIGEKSLTDQLTTETLLFKYGSGVGTNWSTIRAKDEFLSGGGKSSGLLSFLKVSDRNAGAIKSGGTTRRAAKMNILNMDHPEILDYIWWKAKEEDKASALVKMGYSSNMDGEAYETVSGQNSNNSVRISDEFMHSIFNDESAMWKLKGRVDRSKDSEIEAQILWDGIAGAAWRCGDPGVQFDDTINAWHTCPNGEDGNPNASHNRINASNPCSEYVFLDDTACNLASINVTEFYNPETKKWDLEGYTHAVTLIQLILEATIHWGHFPTKDIAKNSYLYRTTGLGLTNLGMLFMEMGIPYDSEEARTVGAALCSLTTGTAYYASSMIAEKIGAFACYEKNTCAMGRVLRNHARAAAYDEDDIDYEALAYEPVTLKHRILRRLGFDELSANVKDIWKQVIEYGSLYGYRNAQTTALAPTGTIAFAMDCATTSSEPFFSHIAYKKLVGGGFMEIINPAIPVALKALGYADEQITEIEAYVTRKEHNNSVIIDGKIEGAPHLLPEHLAVFDTASKCGTGQRYILPEGHVKMMGALTPHISGAISKTVNLPNEAVIDDIKKIYKMAWELGVKAIALYRDGCKVCQPLSAVKNNAPQEKPLSEYTYKELTEALIDKRANTKPLRIKPLGIRSARVHEAAINGLKLYITTSFYDDGRLGEIYVSSGRQGTLTKGLLDSISTTLSEMLQYGVPPEDIAKMYRGQKYEPSGFVTGHPYIKSVSSISDLISKIIDIELGNFTYCQIKPDTDDYKTPVYIVKKPSVRNKRDSKYSVADYIYGEICQNCKSAKMVKNGTCKVCTECGTTTGCS